MFDKIIAHTSFIGETGYSSHSRNFFTALNNLISVKVRNFAAGKTWSGLNNGEPHNNEWYLSDIHKEMLFKQTCMNNDLRSDHYIYGGNEDVEKGNNLQIVLNEVNHYYFYDNYDGPKIAYNVWETTLYPSGYFDRLLEFDQLWVPTKWQRDCVIDQGYPQDRVKIVPEAVDGNIFFPEDVEDDLDEYDGRFKFILFGRWDYRKSIKEIIECFLKTFDKEEPVDLIVSIDNSFATDGISITEDRLIYYGFEDSRIKVKHFPSREDYVKYLKRGHVFLSCARSEGWNLPLIEAMACGTPSIYSNWGAQLEYAEGKGLPVEIIGEIPASDGDGKSYVGDAPGNFCEPDYGHLCEVMRDAYSNYEEHKKKALKDSEIIRKEFTWEGAAKKAMSHLEEYDDNKKLIVNGVEVSSPSDLGFLKDETNRRIYEKYFRVEDNDVVVDIGSHVGLFSLSVIDRNIKKCYCLEPDNKFYQSLLVNIENSGCSDKFVLDNKAIGDHCGYEFFNTVDGLGVEKSNSESGDKYLPTISFLDFINKHNIPRIDFLKLDCEGGEYSIIGDEENYEFIKNNVKKIAGELHLVKVPHSKEAGLDLMNRLKEMGFKVTLNSIDGVDITNYFPSHVDYYTEILFYAEKIKPNKLGSIVDKAFSVGMCQAEAEIKSFTKFLEDKNIKNVLEIGTDQGGTFCIWCHLAGQGGKKISLDIPHGVFGCPNYDKEDRNKQMYSWSDNVSIIEGNSHDKKYIDEIRKILNGEEIDLLFIDGDHTYSGVKKDYEMYKTLVRDGGIIAFHDIKDTEFHRQCGCYVHDLWNDLKGDKKEFRDDSQNYGGIGVVINKKESLDADNSIFVIGAWTDTEEKNDILRGTIEKAKECLGSKVLLVSHYPVPRDVQEMVDYYIYDKCNPILLKEDYQKYNSFPLWWFSNGEYTISVPQIYRHDYACWTSYQNSFNFVKTLEKKYILYVEFDWVIDVEEFKRNFIDPLSEYEACVGTRSQKNMRDFKNNFDACESGIFSMRTDSSMRFINMFSNKKEFYHYCAKNNFFMLESLLANLISNHIGKDNVHYSDYEDFNSEINRSGAENAGVFKINGKRVHLYFCEDKTNGGCYLFLDLRGIENQCLIIDYNNVQKEVEAGDVSDFILFSLGDFQDQRSDIKVFADEIPILAITREEIGVQFKENNIDFQPSSDLGRYDNSFERAGEDKEKILVSFDSSSLGDNIAWMPYAEEYRKKHNCKVALSTFWNDLFEKEYPDIEFIGRGEVVHNIQGQHNIGWYQPWEPSRNPNDFRTIPLQQTASDILDLECKEICPRITVPDKPRTIEGKYVCIGIHGTAQCKYWNYPGGWQKITDYLNEKGYKVVHISKEQGEYMGNSPPENIIDKTGDFPIEDRILDLKHADMFIGISSGLSWLSWAVGTPTIIISGTTAPFCEPQEGIERVSNPNVCNSCFNDPSITFDPGDWDWCPRSKDFECSKSITPDMVIESIDSMIEKMEIYDNEFTSPCESRNLYDLISMSFNYDEDNKPKFTFNFLKDLGEDVALMFQNKKDGEVVYLASYHAKTGINWWTSLNIAKDDIKTVVVTVFYKGKRLKDSIDVFSDKRYYSIADILENNYRMFVLDDCGGVNRLHGLHDLIKENFNKDFVVGEIGSYSGVSSELFAMTCSEVFCMDMWESYAEASLTDYAEKLFDDRMSVYDNVYKRKGDSNLTHETFEDNFFDAVYIDALHTYDGVMKDIKFWLPKIKKYGFICGHDYGYASGVTQAVDEAFGNCEIKVYSDSSWLVSLEEYYNVNKKG